MILDDIVRRKREELERMSEPDLKSLHPSRRNFDLALKSAPARMAVIAEIKKASPSGGILCRDFRPAEIAKTYHEAGAAAISVVTDGPFFQGQLSDLGEASRAAGVPILRKDFIIDERQIYEARLHSADAVLLIAAILNEVVLRRFLGLARSLMMEALVEIHDESDLEKAVRAGSLVVGVNNRDLRTFEVDLETTSRLAPLIPSNMTVVSESGIETPEDVRRLQGVADAVLIGTALMRSENRGELLRRLVRATMDP